MKKILSVVLSILILLSFTACQNLQDVSGSMRVVIVGETTVTYEVDLDLIVIDEGAISIFKYLKAEKGLDYTASGTGEFTFITSIGSLNPDPSKNEYIAIFTSVEKDFDVSSYSMTKTYDGVTVVTSIVGAFGMTIEGDCIVYLCICTY